MNSQDALKLINNPVFIAFGNGEDIEWYHYDLGTDKNIWQPENNLDVNELIRHPDLGRVKPKPKEIWLLAYPDGKLHNVGAAYTEESALHTKSQLYDSGDLVVVKYVEELK